MKPIGTTAADTRPQPQYGYRSLAMWMYSRRQRNTGTSQAGRLDRWDIIGPALLATAFAISTALIFFM